METFQKYIREEPEAAQEDNWASRFVRASSVVTGGISEGAAIELGRSPAKALLTFGGGAAVGLALATASRRFGMLGLSAEVLAASAGYSLLSSGVTKLSTIAPACQSVWNSRSPEIYEHSKDIIGRDIGPFALDLLASTAGGICGAAYGRMRIPKLDHPTLPGSEVKVREATRADIDQIKQVSNVCLPRDRNWFTLREPLFVLDYPGRGVVGWVNVLATTREVGGLAVLPEYRKYTRPLLTKTLETMRSLGGTWATECRESTSYRILKYLERGGDVTLSHDKVVGKFGLFSGEPVHEVRFTFKAKPAPADAFEQTATSALLAK
jgi:hypothetical protein